MYEETYESITFNLEKEKKTAAAKTAIPEDVDDDDALDMFADSLDDTTTKVYFIFRPFIMLKEGVKRRKR